MGVDLTKIMVFIIRDVRLPTTREISDERKIAEIQDPLP